MGHLKRGVKRKLVVKTTGFGRKPSEPAHHRQLIIGGNLGEQKAILGGSGGRRPKLATWRARRVRRARGNGEGFRDGQTSLSVGRRIDEYVLSAERAFEVTVDQ